METSTKPQENRGGDDFLMKFGNFCIDGRGSLIPPPPPKESSPEPRSVFAFLDSPDFQESTCWDPDPVENSGTDEYLPPEETSPERFAFLDFPSFKESSCWDPPPEPAPELPVTASLYPSDIWGSYNTNNYSSGAGEFQGYGLLQMATNPEGSKILMKYLNQGMYVQETFDEVFPDIFKLMCDVSGTKIFENLLRFCNTNDLWVIMKKFVSEKKNFLFAALCKPGSISIQAFIRRLTNTGLEGLMTSLLLVDADVIMTHKHGWYIFNQCFSSFGHEPNERLCCCVLLLFGRLAMDPYGVLVVNAAMDSVRGYARRDLLKLVVKNTEQLSFDPSGHFVVQHCLALKDEDVNQEICAALMGDFVELAQKQGGSYVVEKCIEFSEFGRGLVLAEIFKDDKTLLMLARNKPGNYVVQMALKVTRIRDQAMYEKLVKVLDQPQCPNVIKNAIQKEGGE